MNATMVRLKKARACKKVSLCLIIIWCHSQTTQWPHKERADVCMSLVSVWWSLILWGSQYSVYLDEKDELSELPGYGEGQATESGYESPWYCGTYQTMEMILSLWKWETWWDIWWQDEQSHWKIPCWYWPGSDPRYQTENKVIVDGKSKLLGTKRWVKENESNSACAWQK